MSRPKLETPSVRALFLEKGEYRHVAPGELMEEKGAPSSLLGYISSGRARTLCLNSDGDESTLFYIGADNLVFTESLTKHATVIVSVQAVTDVDLYTMPAQEFMEQWQAKGWPIQELLTHFVRRITLLSDYISCSRLRSSSAKVAYFLYSSYTQDGPVLDFSHEQIATIVGLNRITTNRILNRFAKDGLLKLGYRRVEVVEPQKLGSLINGLGYFDD